MSVRAKLAANIYEIVRCSTSRYEAEREIMALLDVVSIKGKGVPPAPAPICEECDEEMHRHTDPNTGKGGWGCDTCGWSEDDR